MGRDEAERLTDEFMRGAFPGTDPDDWSDRVYAHVRDLIERVASAEQMRCATVARGAAVACSQCAAHNEHEACDAPTPDDIARLIEGHP